MLVINEYYDLPKIGVNQAFICRSCESICGTTTKMLESFKEEKEGEILRALYRHGKVSACCEAEIFLLDKESDTVSRVFQTPC